MKNLLKITSVFAILLLCVALLFSCNTAEKENEPTLDNGEQIEDTVTPDNEKKPEKENQILGKEGNVKFDFVVSHKDGSKVTYKVESTKNTLEGALTESTPPIISGEEGPYGLYVTVVDGEEASWDKDKAYWAFYKDGELLLEGVSSTIVKNGDIIEAVYTQDAQ